MDITGKQILITGAAGGIGSTVSQIFGEAGAKTILVDRAEDRLQKTCGAIEGALLIGGVDLTKAESVQGMVEHAIAEREHIDALINVAGGYAAGEPLHETELSTYDFMMNLNARSIFLTSKAVIPHMIERGEGGRILSFAAKPGLRGGKNNAAYGASKAVVIRLTESMAAELKKHRINVNCLVPGTVNTAGNRDAMPDADHDSWVTPAQLASVLRFLVADESTAVNGAAITVTGYS